MKNVYDLSHLDWTISGYTPYLWRFEKLYQMGATPSVDIRPVKARVPGSVQTSLLDAGVIPDWSIGSNSRDCEWVEHRHWIYRTSIPDQWLDVEKSIRLECRGLDYSGWIYVNNEEVSEFRGSHIAHVFDIKPFLNETDNILEIVFDIPPRWLGQFGYTSQMTDWKPRYNYTWDWVPRIVQIGITDAVSLIVSDGNEFADIRVTADADPNSGTGILTVKGVVSGGAASGVEVVLAKAETPVFSANVSLPDFNKGARWDSLPIDLWWTNLDGEQPLYTLSLKLLGVDHELLDSSECRVGFRNIAWRQCEGSPAGADPWVCVINGKPVFLQGVNFAPIRANFADLAFNDYYKRLKVYKDIGCNMLRLNACGFLESQAFYDICDEMGILVWQEFPLTSSGMENWPPEDDKSIREMEVIARSFIKRRAHHASLSLWCGGNELMGDLDGRKSGMGKPCSTDHPMLGMLERVVQECDPTRRYVPTSPSGPRAGANPAEFGAGVHWDVHGPYVGSLTMDKWVEYWTHDDALFRSELCAAGASPLEIIRQYKGAYEESPPTADNPYWGRPTHWWIDWPVVTAEHGREPHGIDEYIRWSQEHQAEALSVAMAMCKKRFPGIGGVLLWTGHDTFPIPINTSILDYHGDPKPAALALAKIWTDKG